MSLMCVDIGNTNIVSGIYSQDKLTHVQRIETSKDAINQKLNLSLANNVAISSVVPEIHQHILNSSSNNSIFSVSHTNSNIKLDVTKPEDVGNDRLCNMKSIITLKLYPAIIIDFGSATTYDVIDNNGSFIGGAIAPGVDVSAKYLFEKAAQLNDVKFEFPETVIGKTTATNLQSGIMYGGIDAINGMLDRIKKEVSYDVKNIILTGGFSSLLSEKINLPHIVQPNLTLEGIKKIWEENQ